MANYQKYVENVKTIRNLSKVFINDKDDNKIIIDKIKNNAKEAYEYKVWNDNFLKETLFTKEIKDYTKEDIVDLYKFVGETFKYADSIDIGISYKIYEILLKYAKYHNEVPMFIRELYNAGIALFYLDTKEKDNGESLFANKIKDYFIDAAAYLKDFEKLDSDSRQYIIRSLGNTKMAANRTTKEGIKQYFKIYDDSMSVIDSPIYHNIDPSLKWEAYKYGMSMDQLSFLPYLRKHKAEDNKKLIKCVLEAATFVYNKDFPNGNDDGSLENWRTKYFYLTAKYEAGEGKLEDVVDYLLKVTNKVDIHDVSLNGMNLNLTARAYLFEYANMLEKNKLEELKPTLKEELKKSYLYLDMLPGEYYRRTVSEGIRELVDMQSDITDNDKTDMMNYLVAFHKPTYVHSRMVALLTQTLTGYILMYKPECLIGVLDTTTKEEVLAKTEKILNLAYNCGIYHDVGKNMVMSYININERKLIDEEFECIKTHTRSGYELLSKNKDNEAYALAALYHHVYYNGEGGYPANLEKCPSFIKPIVDILTIADCIDAATDSIGRHYKYPKSFPALVEEFRQGSGTKYAPFVVDLFEREDIRKRIEVIINQERLSIYINVYHKGKTYTVSTYQKENAS